MASHRHHFLAGKKIIVAGGGIAGLSFAVALCKLWDQTAERPEIVVYERDTRETGFNREGYSLSLHGADKDSGLVVLQQLGLLKEILDCSVLGLDDSSSFRMWDQDWNELIRIKPTPHGDLPTAGIRAARKDLRRILVDAAEKAGVTIHWRASCSAARRLQDGQFAVDVSGPGGDAEQECNLLVAADGNRSKIRQNLRPDDGLGYAGANQLGGNARFPNGIPRPLDTSWGLALSGQGVCCFFSPNDNQTVVWALSTRGPERQGLDRHLSPEQQRQAIVKEAKEVGHMFAEPFGTVVDATEAASVFLFPARDKEPFYHDAAALGPVIFIGDANHAVSPFAGNGANLALKDGWDLAEALCLSESLDEAASTYDKSSVPRAQASLKTSHQRIDFGHYTGVKATLLRIVLAVGKFFMWLTGK